MRTRSGLGLTLLLCASWQAEARAQDAPRSPPSTTATAPHTAPAPASDKDAARTTPAAPAKPSATTTARVSVRATVAVIDPSANVRDVISQMRSRGPHPREQAGQAPSEARPSKDKSPRVAGDRLRDRAQAREAIRELRQEHGRLRGERGERRQELKGERPPRTRAAARRDRR